MARSRTKTPYTQLREHYITAQRSGQLAEKVEKREVVENIHGLAAKILLKKGLKTEAKALINDKEEPKYDNLYGTFAQGYEDDAKKRDAFGKNHLVEIVNSKNLKMKNFKDALLLMAPEKEVSSHKDLSDAHKEASEFYMDLYSYQNNKELSEVDRKNLMHNMKARVINDYKETFKDDPIWANRLASLVSGYESVALAQYKDIMDAKVKEFTDKLGNANAGKYVDAMKLSDDKRSMFYQIILRSDNGK